MGVPVNPHPPTPSSFSLLWIFRVKRCTVGMHNAMAQIGLETNSSGDVSLEKKKAALP